MGVGLRNIEAAEVRSAVARLCVEANYSLDQDVVAGLERALEQEQSPVGRGILEELAENNRIASCRGQAVCQDTGLAVVFVEMGQDVHIGGSLAEAIDAGVREGYTGAT